ncbi:MAG TPA: peptide deformylase [Elusimicrobiales bacterium]|nr:peptide deformylase [Elusimicrobiales bacterium]
MAVRRICKYGERILRKKCREVDIKAVKYDLPGILRDMFETLDAVGGVGLAANQIGLDMRLFVIKIRKGEEDIRLALINPELAEKSGAMKEEEGCLSFPGLFVKVRRFSRVKMRALNEKGQPVELNAEGLFSKALQHELDHLDGIVLTDRLPFLSRLKLRPVLMKMKREWKKMDESRMKKRDASPE